MPCWSRESTYPHCSVFRSHLYISPRRFKDWNDLIENYIYGSATVVGYFLAHIYGPARDHGLEACLRGARSLAIALQLTNFARDVADDAARGRCYLPEKHGGSTGISGVLSQDEIAMRAAQVALASEAANWYEQAAMDIGAFNPDSRIAIEACHRLYSRLNEKILNAASPYERESLSMSEKLAVLPSSKYWRLPAALIFER